MRLSAKQKYKWAFEKENKAESLICMELTDIVNLSNFLLHVHSAIIYGLMEGPEIDQQTCLKYIALGKRHKIYPEKNWIPPKEFLDQFIVLPTSI